MVEAPGEGLTTRFIRPISFLFFATVELVMYLFLTHFPPPLIFPNSHFNLGFYLDMMKFQACSQLHPRFQGVLV